MKKSLEILSECLKFVEDKFGIEYLANSEYETIGKKGNVSDKIKAKTPKIITLYRSTKKNFTNNSGISEASMEFVQLISTLKHGNIEQDYFNKIVSELKRPLPKDYYGIKCELNVYQHYKTSGIEIIKIPEETITKPDFKIKIDNKLIYVECKSIISESVKLTPRLGALIQKLMKMVTDNLAVNIVLRSKKPDIYEPEVEELVFKAVKSNQEKHYEGDYCSVQLIKPISKNGNDEFVIPNFNPSQNIGDFRVKDVGGKMIGRCVNFFPFFPNDYKSELARHLRKGNSQIEELGKGILHIQFPPMELTELLKFISEHGHRIQHYVLNHSLLAVVINIPYLMEKNGKSNQVITNLNVPYFKYSTEIQKLSSLNPFWLNNYKVIDVIENNKVLKCDFSISSLLNSFALHIRNSTFNVNIKIFIINNQLLHECIIEKLCSVKLGVIPEGIIKENNQLALKIGEVDTIYINGEKIIL